MNNSASQFQFDSGQELDRHKTPANSAETIISLIIPERDDSAESLVHERTLARGSIMLRLLQDSLLAAAAEHPERIALIADNTRMSYAEVAHYACRLAHVLRAYDVRRGDRVAIFMDNSWQCAASIYGVLLAGGIFVAINVQTKPDKLAFILRDADSCVLLTEPHLARVFEPVAAQLPRLRILCTAELKTVSAHIESLDTALAKMPITPPPQQAIGLDLAALIYTSGTTGDPKGVMHTHQSLLFVLGSINEYLDFSADDRLFSGLPLNFGYGLLQWFSAVHAGAALVLERSFTYPSQVFKRMQDEAVTSFSGVPTIFAMMLAQHAKCPLHFPSVRLVTNAAAALPTEFIAGIQQMFPHAGLYKMYGQTECFRSAYLKPALAEIKPESVGCAIPGTELLLLDEEGQVVASGEVGYLHVRGPHLMRGYWKQPERTAEVLIPGSVPGEWLLKTGDLFRQDADGDFYFVARSDEMIKSRGEKVSPAEVENAIYSFAAVQDVIVAGIPDPLLGEAVCAFVSVRDGGQLDVQQIKRICSERLENYMVPKHVLIVPELPRTDNGKLSRKLILQHYAALLAELS